MKKLHNNERGTILLLTLLFVLAFTSLGIASIYFAGQQSEWSDRLTASTEAFWLADAGVQRGYQRFKTDKSNLSINNITLGRAGSSYDITGGVDNNSCGFDSNGNPIVCPRRWQINTTGRVPIYDNGTTVYQTRNIEADVSNFDITNAITSNGTVNDDDGTGSDCFFQGSGGSINGICEQNAGFTFEAVFNGLSKSDVKNLPGTTLYDNYSLDNIPTNGDLPAVTGVTYVTYQGSQNDSLHFSTNGSDSGFLIIDASQSTGTITFNFTGGSFRGIIWVVGDVSLTGGGPGQTNLLGTLFIENAVDSKVSGSQNVTFDSQAIIDALEDVGTSITNSPLQIVSWKEI